MNVNEEERFRGMTANERIYEAGLMPQWEAAIAGGDRQAMGDVLRKAGFSDPGVDRIIDTVLVRPLRRN